MLHPDRSARSSRVGGGHLAALEQGLDEHHAAPARAPRAARAEVVEEADESAPVVDLRRAHLEDARVAHRIVAGLLRHVLGGHRMQERRAVGGGALHRRVLAEHVEARDRVDLRLGARRTPPARPAVSKMSVGTTTCSSRRPAMPPRSLISLIASAVPLRISMPSARAGPVSGSAEPISSGRGRPGSSDRHARERAASSADATQQADREAREIIGASGRRSRSKP